MSDGEIAEPERGAQPRDSATGSIAAGLPAQVTFSRDELRSIFGLYGRKVAAGEWRDYAIDFRREQAVFSVFRRTAEFPLYSIEKNPKMARRQGAYSVIAAGGFILKRGHDLAQVLRVLERPVKLVEA